MEKIQLIQLLITVLFLVPNLLIAQNGTVDSTFGNKGFAYTELGIYAEPTASEVLSDGSIIVAGYYSEDYNEYDWFLAKYDTAGSLYSSFGDSGIVTTHFPLYNSDYFNYLGSIAIQSDGKILAGGYTRNDFLGYDFTLIRYNNNGSLDHSFGKNGIVKTNIGNYNNKNDWGYSITLQSDGKILMAGYCAYQISINLVAIYGCLVRYTSDGKLDSSFASNGIKIIEVPDVTGSIMHSYYGSLQSVKVQTDGKILAAGFYDWQNDSSLSWRRSFLLLRLNSDGTIDTSFGEDGIAITYFEGYLGNPIGSLLIEPNGKIIFSGNARDSLVRDQYFLAKYNENGTLDSSFGLGGISQSEFFDGVCYKILQQTDGKIIAVGNIVGGAVIQGSAVVRYNTDGTLDNTFGLNGISSISYFDPLKPGFQGWNSATLLNNGKLFVAGKVTSGQNFILGIARYNLFENSVTSIIDNKIGLNKFELQQNFPNPFNPSTTIKYSIPKTSFVTLKVYDVLGREVETLVNEEKSIGNYEINFNALNLASGVYFYRLKADDFISTKKLILLK